MEKLINRLKSLKKKTIFSLIIGSLIAIFVLFSLPLEVIKEKYISNYFGEEINNQNKQDGLILFDELRNNNQKIATIYIGTTATYADSSLVILEYLDQQTKEFTISSKVFDFFLNQIDKNVNKNTKIIIGEKEEILKKQLLKEPSANHAANSSQASVFKLFLEQSNKNIKAIGKGLSVIAPVFVLFFMLYLIAMQMGLINKDFEVIEPENIQGNMSDLIGLEDIKREVLQLKDIFNERETYARHDILQGFNVMFTGPAGVGKTKLASYLAKELNLPLIIGSAANLENGFVAGGANRLKGLYNTACKRKRAIIFLDKAEILFKKRGANQLSKFEDDTSNAFLALLDGVNKNDKAEIIWIVATNFDNTSSEMDDAVLRRFQLKINFRLPNRDERLAILKYFISRKDQANIDPDLNLEYIADITTKISPAILKNITDTASMMAVSENTLITTSLLMRSLERHLIGLTDRKTTERLTQQRKTIAIHEMGHFLMHLEQELQNSNLSFNLTDLPKIKENIKVLKISTESISKGGVLGFVLSKSDDKFVYTKSDLLSQVKIYYGGVANEEIFFGKENISTGSYNDIAEATKIIKHMVLDLEMFNDKKINYSLLHQEPTAEKLQQIESLAEKCYKEVVSSLQQYQNLTDYLVPILIDRYSLNIDEIFLEIKSYLQANNFKTA